MFASARVGGARIAARGGGGGRHTAGVAAGSGRRQQSSPQSTSNSTSAATSTVASTQGITNTSPDRSVGQRGGGGGRGGGKKKSGRGAGRGGGGRHDPKQPRPPPTVHVFTSSINNNNNNSSFMAFHARTQAARYKVHAPGCQCPKVKDILSRSVDQLEFVALDGAVDDVHATSNDSNNNTPDEPAEISGLAEEEFIPDHPVNGLVVLPQIKSIRTLYHCTNTHPPIYAANPLQAEIKLKNEIFGRNQVHCDDGDFKVSGAACLLDREPNGFACILSSSREMVNAVRDKARKAAPSQMDLRHADHAHYVVTLPQTALAQLFHAKTRHQKHESQDALFQHLASQGLAVHETDKNNNHGTTETHQQPAEIVLEHHLTSLLILMQKQKNQNDKKTNNADGKVGSNGGNDNVDDDEMFWFVLVYDDTEKTKRRWTLDLPGGKRHLGESALQGAIRETQEECSLVWDPSWVQESMSGSKATSDNLNCYFLLNPPHLDTLEVVE